MKDPGYYSLLWANNHVNGLSWAEIVDAIRKEAVEEFFGDEDLVELGEIPTTGTPIPTLVLQHGADE